MKGSTILRGCAAALGAWLASCAESAPGAGREVFLPASEQQVDAARPTARVVLIDRPDRPLEALDDEQRMAFARGDALFDTMFRASDGLGPLFIRASCASCHKDDGRGPGIVTRVALAGPAERRAKLLPHGDVARPYAAPPATRTLLTEPLGAELVAMHRLPPAVFGRGHMEAVDDAEIERLAALAASRQGPIKGRIHRVTYEDESMIGRFGLKARIATLEDFTADALQGDMGITSPTRPNELLNPEGLIDDSKPGVDASAEIVSDIAAYLRTLHLPERAAHADAGARLFEAAQCATCHAPQLATRADYPVKSLAGTKVAVYTDFLLHDMGDALADGVPDGDANGREWRTAPLIGLRFAPAFMHDGRARDLTGAIAAHASPGSEASDSVARFNALSSAEREVLLAFVGSL